MSRTTGWIVAISAAVAKVTSSASFGAVVADLFGKLSNDRSIRTSGSTSGVPVASQRPQRRAARLRWRADPTATRTER